MIARIPTDNCLAPYEIEEFNAMVQRTAHAFTRGQDQKLSEMKTIPDGDSGRVIPVGARPVPLGDPEASAKIRRRRAISHRVNKFRDHSLDVSDLFDYYEAAAKALDAADSNARELIKSTETTTSKSKASKTASSKTNSKKAGFPARSPPPPYSAHSIANDVPDVPVEDRTVEEPGQPTLSVLNEDNHDDDSGSGVWLPVAARGRMKAPFRIINPALKPAQPSASRSEDSEVTVSTDVAVAAPQSPRCDKEHASDATYLTTTPHWSEEDTDEDDQPRHDYGTGDEREHVTDDESIISDDCTPADESENSDPAFPARSPLPATHPAIRPASCPLPTHPSGLDQTQNKVFPCNLTTAPRQGFSSPATVPPVRTVDMVFPREEPAYFMALERIRRGPLPDWYTLLWRHPLDVAWLPTHQGVAIAPYYRWLLRGREALFSDADMQYVADQFMTGNPVPIMSCDPDQSFQVYTQYGWMPYPHLWVFVFSYFPQM